MREFRRLVSSVEVVLSLGRVAVVLTAQVMKRRKMPLQECRMFVPLLFPEIQTMLKTTALVEVLNEVVSSAYSVVSTSLRQWVEQRGWQLWWGEEHVVECEEIAWEVVRRMLYQDDVNLVHLACVDEQLSLVDKYSAENYDAGGQTVVVTEINL